MNLTPEQWAMGAAAGTLIGFSKTGMPGVGILVVPMLAHAFGGRASVGLMLPMLIFGDVFAVAWYRHHARWDRIGRLLPWVAVGMGAGAWLLYVLGEQHAHKDQMNVIIGWLVLAMLGVHLARLRWGEQLTPHSRVGAAAVGTGAGFTTTASNAAGPIMALYMQSMGFRKQEFMGTTAWYFLIVNVAKLPVFYLLSLATPDRPLITGASLLVDLAMLPVIVAGALTGKWFLPRVRQSAFDGLVLVLSGIAALQLALG
ncbi:MAG: sulfite exporter TauE/SafE family protein [Chthonomonadales bacterium]|nr:sulfite exporter TauE/SafE family protein [Chthonomonadales bacterium]